MVVLAALSKPHDPSLDELLGERAAQIVRDELRRTARRFAAAASGADLAFEATGPGAVVAALAGHEGPVLMVADDVPRLDLSLAIAALEDLASGADVVVGPTFDGTPYLVALPDTSAERMALLELSREALFGAALGLPGGIGMLRAERRLVTAADARAAAADPLLPLEYGLPLSAGLDVRGRRPTS